MPSCCYSFEHDFVEGTVSGSKEHNDELMAREPEKPDHVNTVWNVKVGCLEYVSDVYYNHSFSHGFPLCSCAFCKLVF